ncbi:MAG: CusA/CzcA family heavy metal efflux RND transporter [Flavobacteriales bacterium]|nr:CusA/CzcA family heavy metal efflux RND transporter [Flavobacteriales bacterium]
MEKIIRISVENKLIVFLLVLAIIGGGVYSLMNIPIGSVPDITNNQVQVITTSRNLSTQDVEKYLTYPVELEMANLPNVQEIRSVSKFGLSVVTIVFDEEIGKYIPRQLIEEKLKMAEEKIPAGFGKPFMGPITTGLGEIYQYTLEVDSSHRDLYSITDLRTIQDWVVKRQLSGIPGVVEVNTWGGFLKQYEVSIDPYKLKAMGVSMTEVYAALEMNNSIAGGGYIEKGEQTYFIRGEGLVGSIEDIEQIMIKQYNDVPLLVKDVANVKIGYANRFGAITGNGEGEKVMGQVMMLKGANSKKVIGAVNDRVEEINKHLPPGIKINPFLERSELIAKTTFTISENLVLGFVIVLLVVILLLGNWRSGIVVASVIPLTLFIALIAMYVFGIDANLLSLGAIDFGIIIDGAVIIVEFIAFRIASSIIHSKDKKGVNSIDEITIESAAKMMKSAVFGQLIIMIVFLPILTLSGVEGKMFVPMALVFCFAVLGAMLLCFTYVPVVASLLLKPNKKVGQRTVADRLVDAVYKIYKPVLLLSIRAKYFFIGGAVALLVFAVLLFGSMGGEFVPTLDEGDIVIQPALKTGTSLSETVEMTTKIEKILLEFSEVDQVVTRIGAAEVPTDPMSMEESDVIIKLKPKDQWVHASSKDELVDMMKVSLKKIPGVDFEFTQPIEMRFNELITGVRADLAIKIFGEDLDVLYAKALEIQNAIKSVEGAADIIVEKTAGLPQMIVAYDYAKMSKYGVSSVELNNLLTMGFAGLSAGTVFEGEKQFDLVVKLDTKYRQDIQDVKNLLVTISNGQILPLSEFADIQYTEGPAKISRDNTNRRIVIGVNVRGRDLASVVADIQKIINSEIDLPTGYKIEYGGQFENLASAKQRLLIAVPVALFLIFILLYFAFRNLKEALMIFTAIPFAAVGGVFMLWFRDMPFSISAGVGFIALFGIAVLNGIVLIEEFKELNHKGLKSKIKIVLVGTKQRLRPVILTAAAAALGFLPMAISTNAGAEVQRPLATVVIGGLISSTLLTLVILPNLYLLFTNISRKSSHLKKGVTGIVALCLISGGAFGQQKLTLEGAIAMAKANNGMLKAQQSKLEASRILEGTSFELNQTDVYYGFDQNNIAPNNLPLHVFGIAQSFQLPSYYKAKKEVFISNTVAEEKLLDLMNLEIERDVSNSYNTVLYWSDKLISLNYMDSLYAEVLLKGQKGNDLGELSGISVDALKLQKAMLRMDLDNARISLQAGKSRLSKLIQLNDEFDLDADGLSKLGLQISDSLFSAYFDFKISEIDVMSKESDLLKREKQPAVNLGVFNGVNQGVSPNSYYGMQIGLSFNLQPGVTKKKVDYQIKMIEEQQFMLESDRFNFEQQLKNLLLELQMINEMLVSFENGDDLNWQVLVKKAVKAMELGEIDTFQMTQLISQANDWYKNYLDLIYRYNELVIEINYLTR